MSEAWRLARRDLLGGRAGLRLGGLGLMWLCLAISVAAIASVLSVASSIDRAIANNGRSLLGGDLVVRSAQRQASDEELAVLRRLGPVSASVTLRAMANAAGGKIALGELSSVDTAWPLAGALELAPGGRRPACAEVAVGREMADRLGLRPGSPLRVGYATLTVSGIIERMPAMSGFAFAPPMLVDAAGLRATGLVRPGSLTTSSYRLLLPDSRDPRASGKMFQLRFPDGGWSVTDRNEAGQGTRRFVERVADMLLLVALAALAIGGLGIASAASAFAASRRATVATLKLLGAGRRTLGAMLVIEVALIAALAILAGLAVGALAPALASAAMGSRLPIAPDGAPQWLALAQSAAFGLLVTGGAAWGPLAAAVSTRPASLLRGDVDEGAPRRPSALVVPLLAILGAAALAIAGADHARLAAGGVAAILILAALFAMIGYLVRLVARVLRHRGGPITRLGVAALDRPGAATARLSVALGLGLALLVTLASVAQSLLAEIDGDVPSRAPALFLIDLPATEEARFRSLVAASAPGAELRLVPSLRGPVTAVKGVPVSQLGDIPEGAWILRGDRGLTFARDLPVGNRIVAGQWWPAHYRGPPLISLDVNAATALKIRVGDTLTVSVLGRPIEARIASLREIDWRSMGFNFAIIFAPGVLEQAPFTMMASVSTRPGAKTDALEQALVAQLPMVSAIRVSDIVAQVRTLLLALAGAVRVATGVALLLGVIVLAGAVVATRQARARDLVLLKLVGASRGQVLATQAIEFALLSVAITASAFAAGIGAARLLLHASFDLPFRPDWPSLAVLASGAVAVTVGAALVAALPALLARPALALRVL